MNPSGINNSKTEKHDDMHLWLSDKDNQDLVIASVGRKLPSCYDWPKDWGIQGHKGDFEKKLIKTRLVHSEIQIIGIKREVPVYSQNYKSKYLQGICDAIIKFRIVCSYEEKQSKLILMHGYGGRRYGGEKEKPIPEKYDYCETDTNMSGDEKWNHYYAKSNEIKERAYKEDCVEHGYTCSLCEVYEVDRMGYRNKLHEVCRILIDFKPVLTSISGVMGQLQVYRDCIGPSHLMIITYDENDKYDGILKEEGIGIIRIEQPKEDSD